MSYQANFRGNPKAVFGKAALWGRILVKVGVIGMARLEGSSYVQLEPSIVWGCRDWEGGRGR